MPLKKCQSEGKSGWKWGNSGHCYTGPDAKKKALEQGRAIEANKAKANETLEFNEDRVIKDTQRYLYGFTLDNTACSGCS